MKTELYTPVAGDILDKYGKIHQFFPPQIQPIRDTDIIVGRAMSAIITDVYEPQAKPFGLLTESLDQLEQAEVFIASGRAMRCANWGEILTVT